MENNIKIAVLLVSYLAFAFGFVRYRLKRDARLDALEAQNPGAEKEKATRLAVGIGSFAIALLVPASGVVAIAGIAFPIAAMFGKSPPEHAIFGLLQCVCGSAIFVWSSRVADVLGNAD